MGYSRQEAIKMFMGINYDITHYDNTFPEGGVRDTRYVNATFIGWRWEYIGNLSINDPALSNEFVRADQNSGDSDEDLAYDYEVNGWDISSFPPTKGTDGSWEDGRTRVRGAILRNQDWIPVALYNFEDNDTAISDRIANALVANNHKKAKISVMEDFVIGGIGAVESGEIKRTPDEIMFWLINKAKIESRFDNVKGIFTKIQNKILSRTSKEKELVTLQDREDWLLWIDKMKGVNPDHILLYLANTGTAASRFWTDHVLSEHGKPKPIILYTNSYSPHDCANDVDYFVSTLMSYHKRTYAYVNNGITSQTELFSIKAPTEPPFKILGVIPNLKKADQPKLYKEHKIVDVDNYIYQGCNISKILQLVA